MFNIYFILQNNYLQFLIIKMRLNKVINHDIFKCSTFEFYLYVSLFATVRTLVQLWRNLCRNFALFTNELSL